VLLSHLPLELRSIPAEGRSTHEEEHR
jgi:hypothetical protein